MQHLIAARTLANEQIARHEGILTVDMQTLRLMSLSREPLSAGEIATTTGLPTSTVTRVIDRLVRAGYVRRLSEPHDKRKTLVAVDRGRLARISRNYDAFVGAMDEVNAGFSDEELALVARYIEEIAARTPAIARTPAPRLPDAEEPR
jgi:DNA-binding MarR family transcriptional regulator